MEQHSISQRVGVLGVQPSYAGLWSILSELEAGSQPRFSAVLVVGGESPSESHYAGRFGRRRRKQKKESITSCHRKRELKPTDHAITFGSLHPFGHHLDPTRLDVTVNALQSE
jgi:hypothetical protein